MITSACFYPYSNNTIIGGCYNGQLLLWDLRTKSLPVQRTGLSSSGHKYPVYSLNVVGTQIANNIVSISNDGKLCSWDIKAFSTPVKVTKLENKSDINVTCAEFPEGDVNNFYFGAENGLMYRSTLHNSQANEEKYTIY
jgi:dynein intermediate chain